MKIIAYEPHIEPIAQHPLIADTFAISEKAYDIMRAMPTDEKWDTTARFRYTISMLLVNVARAAANAAPCSGEWDWSYARKDAASMLALYRLAVSQGFVTQDVDFLLALDRLILQIDERLKQAYQTTADYNVYEVQRWQEKYDMGKKLNKEFRQ